MTGLFEAIFVPDDLIEAVSDSAYLAAMLDFEAALARAEARAGVIPAEAAEKIARACDARRFDPEALGREARASGNPAVPLVRALTEAAPRDAGRYVHWGATSQDVVDTAAMLVARRARELILADLDGVAAACANLAAAHRDTLMPGRTLLQQALPITFGFKAAGWLVAVVEARERLDAVRPAVQLGGAAGTLASLGGDGLEVLAHLADELDLPEPALPWHTNRVPVADLGANLALTAGALGKLALDLALLAQTEVGEVSEAAAGGSSTMPHKRNPVGAIRARACARRAQAAASVLIGAMDHEHERAAGAWHAEWEALRDALAATGGAARSLRGVLEDLEVHPERMRENLERTRGLLLSEHAMMALAEHVGRGAAKGLVEDAARRVAEGGGTLRDELVGDAAVREHLSPEQIDAALDPAAYLGSAHALIDRALASYERLRR